MPCANHLVGYHGGQQRLYGRQHGDGKGIRQYRRHRVIRHGGQSQLRQGAGDRVKIPDGIHWQGQQLHRSRRHHHGDERGGNLLKNSGPEDQHRQGQAAHTGGGPIRRVESPGRLFQLFHRFHRGILKGQSKKVLHLADENGDGNSRRKTSGDGIRYEFNHASHPQHTHQDQHKTRQNRSGGEPLHAVPGHNSRHNGSKRRGRAGDQNLSSAQDGNQQPGNNRGIQPLFRRYAGGQRQGDGQGQGNNGHDNPGGQIPEEILLGIVFKRMNQLGSQVLHKRISFLAWVGRQIVRRTSQIIALLGGSHKAVFGFSHLNPPLSSFRPQTKAHRSSRWQRIGAGPAAPFSSHALTIPFEIPPHRKTQKRNFPLSEKVPKEAGLPGKNYALCILLFVGIRI